jgi:dihydroceramidase
MINMSCTVLFVTLAFRKSTSTKGLLFIFSLSLAIAIAVYYHYLKDPAFHQNMFASITSCVVLKGIYDMEKHFRQARRARHAESNANKTPTDRETSSLTDQRDSKILREMWQMVICAVSSVGFGFLLWNLDNIFCTSLRQWRRSVGLPWGILLEGHGWW